ncbi:MAG: glycolate oxidase subunit GlcE [Beijerinckiaceae bacterium]
MIHQPADEKSVAEIVRAARDRKTPLVIEGGGTKAGFGRPVQAAATLSLKKLSGITLYEPSEMVIGAWAGTPLADVQKALDAKGQMFAFEPPDYSALLGAKGKPTIGAVAACALAGPRRLMAGGARDSLIGVRFVNGRGEIIKNGGRVMKNVTGLDLVKLQAGAFGTLGVLTEVIFRVVPKPPTMATLMLGGRSDADGVALLCKAMGTPFEPTGAAHLPAGIGGETARTLLRIEGFPDQIAYRSGELFKRLGKGELVEGKAHDALWAAVRGASFLAEPHGDAVWRISVPPAKGAAAAAAIGKARSSRWFFDWSGGLVWLATSADGDAGAALVHRTAQEAGGHATLIRAPEAVRAAAPVFQTLDPAVQKLQAGLKASFDPDGILNPGRMYAGV